MTEVFAFASTLSAVNFSKTMLDGNWIVSCCMGTLHESSCFRAGETVISSKEVVHLV